MKKRLLSLLLIVCLGLGAVGCSTATKTNEVSQSSHPEEDIVAEGIYKLSEIESPYIVATVVSSSSTYQSYFEYVDLENNQITSVVGIHPEEGYTLEMSEMDENTIFSVSDYIDESGKMILVGYQDEETKDYTGWELPIGYKEFCDSRAVLYVDTFLGNFETIHKLEDITTDIGNGMEKLQIFSGEVKSDVISEMIGVGSTKLYEELMYSHEDLNLKKLLGWYSNGSRKATACSNGDYTIGLDANGILKLMTVEVGGIGDYLNITKVVITDTSIMDRVEQVVVENPQDYAVEFTEMAEMCAPYNTYQEAIDALYHTENDTGTSVYDASEDLLDDSEGNTVVPEEGDTTIEVDMSDAENTTIQLEEDENATLELTLPTEKE